MKQVMISILVITSAQSAFADNRVCEKAVYKAVFAAEMEQKKQDSAYSFDIGEITTIREPKNGEIGIYEVQYSFNEECSGGYTVGAKPSTDGNKCKVIFVRSESLEGACG